MIENIAFSVRFPPTDLYPLGRAFDRNIDFGKGMTNIVGPNEAGKSLILEMIEFLLFGSAALRGAAADYKHLGANGVIVIRGQAYTIRRTARGAELRLGNGGQVLATGTKPVNARILALLGYGLDVFRVANVANQGDAERLSRMRPTERKAMVDKLIGADRIEAIAKWCGEQALGVAREIAGLESGLVEPVEPVKPEGYRPVAELQNEIAQLRAADREIVEMRAFLANKPDLADEPWPPGGPAVEALERAEQVLGLRTYDFDLAATEAAWDAALLWQERVEFIFLHPEPNLTEAVAAEQLEREDLERDLDRLARSPVLTCPCGKEFTSADAEIARIEARLQAIPPLTDGIEYDFHEELRRHRDWAKPETQAEWARLKDMPEVAKPAHHPVEAKGAVHIGEVTAELERLGMATWSRADVQQALRTHRAHAESMAIYHEARRRWEAWAPRAAQAQARIAELEPAAVRLPELEALLTAATVYEAQLAAYQGARAAYDERAARLAELRVEQASWRNGKQAMNDLRQETKTYIVPALSRVASYMMHQMTGGKRSRVVVDEDFEISVDGQALNTLSGSGKVCANLAIRLGLGRILTHGVFPVFLGDELDGSMDQDRAACLHTALAGLQDKLSQIVVITHKAPTCPQVITLGE